ncbi:hypothetical protein E2C01_071734 [Portunus trituberculatus]|uniref:Uncharacterized protein n=1 Tax=Portunus trituberculatus TaxID=210409 RepID=A0A5B7I4Q1_PORTR|nr:hypothetical protein [Portunus trituberculatus]
MLPTSITTTITTLTTITLPLIYKCHLYYHDHHRFIPNLMPCPAIPSSCIVAAAPSLPRILRGVDPLEIIPLNPNDSHF